MTADRSFSSRGDYRGEDRRLGKVGFIYLPRSNRLRFWGGEACRILLVPVVEVGWNTQVKRPMRVKD